MYCLKKLDKREIMKEIMNWFEGQKECEAIGGHLPKLTYGTATELHLIPLIDTVNSEAGVWIG